MCRKRIAQRDGLAEVATADYLAARADARVVDAGPGRFGRKAKPVDAARARRADTARRWSEAQLPGSKWADETLRRAAEVATERVVARAVEAHIVQADRQEQAAASFDHKVMVRDHEYQVAIGANQAAAAQDRRALEAARADVDQAVGNQDRRRPPGRGHDPRRCR